MEFLGIHKAINSTEPLVSVCIQVYNNEAFIEQCLKSILSQKTEFPFEIIVGEDDSTDRTREICKDLAEKHQDRIRLFLRSEKDKIYYKGRKTSRFNYLANLRSARGKFIALCDGDDYWISEFKLQRQVELLQANMSLIAVHHWQKYAIEGQGVWKEIEAPKSYGYGYCNDEVSSVVRIFKNEMRLKARTLMFRNVVAEDFFPDWIKKVAFADVSVSFLLGKYGDFGFMDEDLAVYRQSKSERLSTAGIKELGRRKFKVEHLQNYIEIWDRANVHYNYKYNTEAKATIKYFYQEIIQNNPNSHKVCWGLLRYNVLKRPIPFYRTFYSNRYLSVYLVKVIFRKLRKKLRI